MGGDEHGANSTPGAASESDDVLQPDCRDRPGLWEVPGKRIETNDLTSKHGDSAGIK